MPGRVFLTTPLPEIAALLGLDPGQVPDTPPRHNIAPGEQLPVITDAGVIEMRWGIIPVGRINARGRPVMETIINARSETLFDKSAYEGMRRGVVPVDGWYEWTGVARRKTPWQITARDGATLYFAAIWDTWTAPGGKHCHRSPRLPVNQMAMCGISITAWPSSCPHRTRKAG